MGMVTATSLMRDKLQLMADVKFHKDESGNRWWATLDGEAFTKEHRTLSQAVWDVARQLGEEV